MHRIPLPTLALLALAVLAAACGGGSTPALDSGPSITAVAPASGGVGGGTSITIQGTALSNPQPGAYQVLIGGQPATGIAVISDSEVECTTPAGAAGPADVTIVNLRGEGTATGAFMYYPPPTVASIDPAEGTRFGGVNVEIKGTGFLDNDPGPTVALIDEKPLVDQVVVDDETIQGKTPSSWLELAKDVVVRNLNGEAVLPNGFLYTGPLPLVYSLTPNEGPRTGGTAVTITGDWFTIAGGSLSVRFGNAEAALVTRVDDQTLTCVSPNSAISGWVSVTAENNNGFSTLPNAFYYIPPPELTLITPNSGSAAGGTAVTILGSGFTAVGAGTPTVTIGGNAVGSLAVVDDNTITCTTPPSSIIGAVNVDIVNGNGSDLLANAFTYTDPSYWDPSFGSNVALSDDSYSSVSLGFTFNYFSSNWSTAYVVSNGEIQFTSPNQNCCSGSLLSIPQIQFMAEDLRPPSTSGYTFFKSTGTRGIVTFQNVPWYSSTGSITCQTHMMQGGMISMLWQTITWNSTGNTARISLNPGGGTVVSPSGTLRNGYTGGGPSDTITYQYNSSSWDLDNSHLLWIPNGSGGYDCIWINGLPTPP